MSEHEHPAVAVAERAEARWVWVVVAVVGVLLLMMVYTSLHWLTMPPQRMETINPGALHLAGEFVENNLGSALENDGSVTVRVVASQYSFTPQCVLVPAGTPVTIRATSADVVHGFSVTDTNVNLNLVPGYISTYRTTFPRQADHMMPCHEYCGTGHAAMWARVKVIDRETFKRQAQNHGRLSCAERS